MPAFRRWRELWLVLVVIAALAAILALPPIPQDPRYHALADGRMFFGVPNFLNVASNLAFLLVGAAGLFLCSAGRVDVAARSWTVFFLGTALVAFGSGYYHWAPADATLVWDRIPMTIAFMALLVALVSEHVAPRREAALLAVALAVGIASIVWWRYTDDLRFYIWVQLAPLLVIVFGAAVVRDRYGHRGYLLWGLACYGLAKVAEFQDAEIFAVTGGTLSGHTLKHLLAALAALCVYLMLASRSRIAAASSSLTSLHSS